MGQSQSNQATKDARVDFNPQVEVVQKVYEPHYGEIKIVREVNTQEQMILKDIVVNTKEAFEKEIDYLTKRVDVKHPNVVNILGYNTQDKHNFCSTYYKISLFIEYLEQDLLKEQESRKALNSNFSESEVLYIADNLIAGLSSFQSHGISHGDIRPFNIFIKDNNYKLSDPTLNAQKGSNGLTAAIVQGSKTLLSPQLLEQVPKGNFEIKADRYKADVFSLGATLLGLSTLTNSEDFYDYQAGTVNASLLDERLSTLKRTHSDFTYDLIKSMLAIEEEARPDFVMLSNRLLPYQDQIRSGYVNFGRGNFQFETAKRSALPTDDTDDLEARIKAALERTAATFRAVEARDGTNYQSTTTYTTSNYTYTPQQVSYTPQQVSYTPTTYTTTVYEGEQAKRSALPDTTAEVGNYTTTAYEGEQAKRSALPDTTAEVGNYTTATAELGNYATPSADAGSYSTQSYVPAAAYTTHDVLRTSYTQPTTYSYTSSYLPANTAGGYTTPGHATTAGTTGAATYEVSADKGTTSDNLTKSYVAGDYTSAYNQPYTSTYATYTTYDYTTSYGTGAETTQKPATVEGTQAQTGVEGTTEVNVAAENIDTGAKAGEAVSQNAL
jgi:serine/threonine protein kinase